MNQGVTNKFGKKSYHFYFVFDTFGPYIKYD